MNSRNYLLLISTIWICFVVSACDDKKEDTPTSIPSFVIEPDSINLAIGETYQLVAKLNGVPLKSEEVEWYSPTNMYTVDGGGLVTGAMSTEIVRGTAIYATHILSGAKAECKITVYGIHEHKYRLILKDKGISSFSVNNPENYLSKKAIERRQKKKISIDETDLPISPEYIKAIEEIGGVIVAKSKWLNSVSIHCTDKEMVEKYKKLPFVKEMLLIGQTVETVNNRSQEINNIRAKDRITSLNDLADYGSAWDNININNGQVLHEKGFKGEGMDIAVIDAGFINLKTNPSLNNIKIKGAKSFIYGNPNAYDTDNHGVWVTSCMATNKPGYYIGTAPEASYWLLRTEDIEKEYALEEDYWVAAVEYADSVGVDVINTSLYFTDRYRYEDMDGKTAFPTRAANIAAKKGILIVCCAGNHGSWVGAPSDSPSVLTVGSVYKDGAIHHFTAYGITVDGRMKPDIVSLGSASVINIDGSAESRSGTSYASPIICGLSACLWQAYPQLTNSELREIIIKTSNRYSNPEVPYGNGIPDMEKAMQLAQKVVSLK